MPESNPPFATAALMEARSQGEIPAETPFLGDELDSATRAIREFCRWHVAPARQVTYRRAGADREDVWLPASEVASIDAAVLDGRELSPAEVALIEFDPLTGWTNMRARRFSVTFTAGYDDVPADVVTACLSLAAFGLGTALGQVREQAGTVSLTYGAGGLDEGSPLGQKLIPYRLGRLP